MCATEGRVPGSLSLSWQDRAAHEHGAVISEAEYQQRSVTEQDRVLLIASDGVFEYLDSQACVDIIVQYTSPMDG